MASILIVSKDKDLIALVSSWLKEEKHLVENSSEFSKSTSGIKRDPLKTLYTTLSMVLRS